MTINRKAVPMDTHTVWGASAGFASMFAKQIAISILISAAINTGFALLLFDRAAPVPLWGTAGMAVDLVPSTFMPALMMTFGITMTLHAQIDAGALSPRPARSILPRALVRRALFVGIAAVVVIVPPVLAVLALGYDRPWTWWEFVTFKLAFSVLHGVVVTPFVVLEALKYDR